MISVDGSITPIGTIMSDFKNPKDLLFACEDGLKTSTKSIIIIDPKLQEGLKGLDQFSHIFVIYILHEAKHIELQTYPGPTTVKNLEQVGVFASRSQYRPNHIALRLCEIINVKNNEIQVKGLDAINGSKVLDIKPYVPGFDRPTNFKVADWYTWFDKNKEND